MSEQKTEIRNESRNELRAELKTGQIKFHISNPLYYLCYQIYYGAKNRSDTRTYALLAFLAANLLLLAVPNFYVVMTISSFLFIGFWALNIFVSLSNINRLFKAPHSYFTALVPVASWKILFGTVLPAVIFDSIGFVIGLGGLTLQIWNIYGWGNTDIFGLEYLWFVILAPMIMHGILLLVFAFWRALSKSVFYRFPLSGFFGAFGAAAVIIVLSWINLLLVPFGEINRFGVMIFMVLELGQISAVLVSLVLLLQGAVLLFLTAYLMDRRINL